MTVDTNEDEEQQTVPKVQERPRTRGQARARPSTPLPHPDFPMMYMFFFSTFGKFYSCGCLSELHPELNCIGFHGKICRFTGVWS